jgi:hypothetical protein
MDFRPKSIVREQEHYCGTKMGQPLETFFTSFLQNLQHMYMRTGT